VDVSPPPGDPSEARLPPTPESINIPLLDLQFPGQHKTPDPIQLSRVPPPGSLDPDLGRGMQPPPPKPKLPTLEGKERPPLHAKLPEGQRPEKPEDLERPKVKPTSGHDLPTQSLPMKQNVSLICICEQPIPTMAFQELNTPGHGTEKIKSKTYQTPASSSNANPVPLPKLLEPQVREQQTPVSNPSAHPKQTQTQPPYKHSETLGEKTSQTLRNHSVSLRCMC
jgi:hypothetical protein